MEKGVLTEDAKLGPCSCESPLCAHCSLHKALLHDSLKELGIRTGEAGDDDASALLCAQSTHLVDGGAARKLKLPCRRNSGSITLSPVPPRSRKSWPPLPLPRTSSLDSVAYADACVDLQKSEKRLDPSMLTTRCKDDQEIMSTHPALLEQQFTAPKKPSKASSSPQGRANPQRTCRYCRREFPSGRALGGHMRVHGGLEADRSPLMHSHTKREEEHQINGASVHNSSSELEDSKRAEHFMEVNCLVSGSKHVNSSGGGVFRRRINSEESMVRGIDERKLVATRGPISHGSTEEENLLRREEQLLKEMKGQSVAKKGAFTSKEINAPVTQTQTQTSILDDANENYGNNDDDDDYDHLQSSKLMVLGNASEIDPQEINQANRASGYGENEGNPLHKLRPNPRPSRRRFWTDREDLISDNNHSLVKWSSSPPAFRGLTERAHSCSECGKAFWSWKALFGHMRCHPEREWRGIQRPEASSSELENKQFRACKKQSSLSLVTGSMEVETELESDAENRQDCTATQATPSVCASAKEEGLNTEEIACIASCRSASIKEADDELQKNAEEFSMKGGTKRGLKSEESADDGLTPSAWPTRKRSRRNRAMVATGAKVTSTTSAEPALTSETATSSELRDHEKVSIKDQEDLDMANCLVLLSSAGNKAQDSEKHYMRSTQESVLRKRSSATNPGQSQHVNVVSCGDDDDGNDGLNDGDGDGDDDDDDVDENEAENVAVLSKRPNASGMMKYECSTCRRCFKSHQALGGHRASHRKTKGCFALMNQQADEVMQESKEDNIAEVDEFVSTELDQWQAMGQILSVAPPSQQDAEKLPFALLPSTIDEWSPVKKKKKLKGHACSICHRIFPSGQALGGHKRCHWTGEKIAESGSMASSSSNNNNKVLLQEQAEYWAGGDGNAGADVYQAKRAKDDSIDLNLPAPLDEEDEAGYDNVGLSSTDAVGPEMQNDVEDAELDGEEEDMEGHLVDFIGGKRRSLNGLSDKWPAVKGRRRQEAAW